MGGCQKRDEPMQLSKVDEFFSAHPLKEQYFNFSGTERAGTAAVALRDVRSVLAGYTIKDSEQEFFEAAVAEQTIFLLLNPEYLTGAYTRTTSLSSAGNSRKFSGQESVLGQRTAALLAPLLENAAAEKKKYPENSSSGNSSTGAVAETENCGTLRLERG